MFGAHRLLWIGAGPVLEGVAQGVSGSHCSVVMSTHKPEFSLHSNQLLNWPVVSGSLSYVGVLKSAGQARHSGVGHTNLSSTTCHSTTSIHQ
ncbi:hypothetical protein ILYODFUR_012087 [Ilyodon furcidens]|uniref:Uncharacterized protein n=1 Tax=Ilyodon furcidens TaxID=33524 RepID=A0ABV0TAP2_9TELE